MGDKSAWDPDDVEEWNAAIDEFRAIEKASKEPGRPKPGSWNTEIPELLASPFKQDDLDQVLKCMAAVEPIEARGMTVVARVELAANFAASAMEHGYRAGEETGASGDGASLFEIAADLIIRRAREI